MISTIIIATQVRNQPEPLKVKIVKNSNSIKLVCEDYSVFTLARVNRKKADHCQNKSAEANTVIPRFTAFYLLIANLFTT